MNGELDRRRRAVRVVYDHLGRKIADRWREKEVCAIRDFYDGREGFWRGRIFEHERDIDLELMYLIHRLLRASLDYLDRIGNPQFQSLAINALRFKGCLACLAIYGWDTSCYELLFEFLIHVTGIVVDAGEGDEQDQNKIGFSIRYLSETEGGWGYTNYGTHLLNIRQGRRAEFRSIINRINRDFFEGRYDLLNYLKTLATTFRPRMPRTFQQLVYIRTPARWPSRLRQLVREGACRRYVEP